MGNVLRSKGDYNGAIELNKNALEMDSTNIDASYNLSLCYLFIKDYEKAWNSMRQDIIYKVLYC